MKFFQWKYINVYICMEHLQGTLFQSSYAWKFGWRRISRLHTEMCDTITILDVALLNRLYHACF